MKHISKILKEMLKEHKGLNQGVFEPKLRIYEVEAILFETLNDFGPITTRETLICKYLGARLEIKKKSRTVTISLYEAYSTLHEMIIEIFDDNKLENQICHSFIEHYVNNNSGEMVGYYLTKKILQKNKGEINMSSYNYNGPSAPYGTGTGAAILKGSVVLCQHCFLGKEETMTPLFNNLKTHVFKSFYGCVFCENILKYTELGPSNPAITEIVAKVNSNPERNVFVRTFFSNATSGAVTTQANELKEMILEIKKVFPNMPIVLIGYSKGGVVNCKCAIDNPGLIDRIINIGTPHTDTFVQDVVSLIGQALIEKYGTFLNIPNIPVRVAIQALVNLVNNGVDAVLNETVTYSQLKNQWNALTNKPKFIPIAGKAIVFNGEFDGDFVVPTDSAIANGFAGRTYNSIINNFIVDDDKIIIQTSVFKNILKSTSILFDILTEFSDAIVNNNAVKIMEALFDIVYNVIINDNNLSKCLKLAHANFLGSADFILTHKTVASRVLAGFNN